MAGPRRLVVPADFGFGLLFRHGGRSLALAVAAGLGFGIWMAAADSWLFASVVPDFQHQLVAHVAISERIVQFGKGALVDELILRLLCMTGIACILGSILRQKGPATVWSAILLTAFVAWPISSREYLLTLDPSLLTGLREVLLHCTAGVLWGWLYWRHGWLAAVTGHVAAHVSLQPLLNIL